jgi:uncharacterized protein YbjT (DUF2867 family)
MKRGDRMQWVNEFVDEAKQIGSVKLIVFGSSYGADSDTTILGKEFRIGEKKIEQSGIPYCFIRLGPMLVRKIVRTLMLLLVTFSLRIFCYR